MRLACPAAIVWAVCATQAAAQILSVTLQKPARDFGVFAGDSVSATAIIRVGPDTVLDAGSLPPPGPISANVDVRRVAVSENRDGSLVAIRVDYQSFMAPPQVIGVEVPGYTAAFTHAGARLVAPVPGFSFTASPFRHDLQVVTDPTQLRPDHPGVPAVDPAAAWLAIGGGALAVLAGAVLLAGPGRFGRRTGGPFAAAHRQIAGLGHVRTNRKGETARTCSSSLYLPASSSGADRVRTDDALASEGARLQALLALHRAFDATAGRRVLAGDLDELLLRQPRLAPLRREIAMFFAWSREAFFNPAASAPPPAEITRLARALSRAERS